MDDSEDIHADIDVVGFHCNEMNDAGNMVNELQNSLTSTEREIKEMKEYSERRSIDLSLKHKYKIDQAYRYHASKKKLVHLESISQEAALKHQEACDSLTNARDKMVMDPSGSSSSKLRLLRECVKESELALKACEMEVAKQMWELARLGKKYKKSIDSTEEYFHDQGKRLRAQVSHWRDNYSHHLDALRQISAGIHLEREARSMVDRKLRESISFPNSDDHSLDLDMDPEMMWKGRGDDCILSDDSQSLGSLSDSFSSLPTPVLPSPTSPKSPLPGRGSVTLHEKNVEWHPLA